jgi:hypothetical protein
MAAPTAEPKIRLLYCDTPSMARNSVGQNEVFDYDMVNCADRLEEGRAKSGSSKKRFQNSAFLNQILNKMDKFGSCEKLLDREGFFGEYHKEISRKTKPKVKKP